MKNLILSLASLLAAIPTLAENSEKKISVTVTEAGFSPNSINVKPGTEVTLNVTRITDQTCSTEILVPSKNIKKSLPLNQKIAVDLGIVEKGTIKFGCAMNLMDSGMIFVN